MDEPALTRLLCSVATGETSPDQAVRQLERMPYSDLGFARVDHHRPLRQRLAEAVYAPGKTPGQCAAIVTELLAEPAEVPVLLTRADPAQAGAAVASNPGACRTPEDPDAPLSTLSWRHSPARTAQVVVITAGTADLPVAAECIATLTAYGFFPTRIVDCGVAGVHRIVDEIDTLARADTVVVVAGMEGALASLVAGLTPAPVVAVPTSAGYGASLEGVTALLAMHASCAAGLVVVGIDNGFGAACAVARMLW